LLIIIVIVHVVTYSDELLPHVRTSQQEHCNTNYVFLPDL
jgi:hypothetical protein